MESKQDNDYITCPKRKKETFSDLKIHSDKGDYFAPASEIYGKVSEPRPICVYNKSNTFIYDFHKKTKTEKVPENTNAYQIHNKICHILLKPMDIYFYDTKNKCYYSSFNPILAGNSCYTYSGADVNRLLIFMEYTNKTIERLFRELNKIQSTPDLSAVILVINPKKVKELLKVNKEKIKINVKSGYFNYKTRDTSLYFSNVTNDHFDIKIKNHCVGLKISIRKYTGTLLETLTAVCNMARCFFPTVEIKVPSVFGRNWYFRNVIQGILLKILLKNANVNNLNIASQLYYVLITDAIPYFSIEINLILKKGVYITCTTYSSKHFISNVTEWSYLHKYILRKSRSCGNWLIINRLYETPHKSLKAITYYTKSTASNQADTSLHYQESTESFDRKTYIRYSNTDIILYSLSHSDIADFFSVNQSVGTSFTFPANEIIFNKYQPTETKNASTICDIEVNISLLSCSKLFLRTLFNDLKIMNYCLNVHSQHDFIHKTLCEAVPAATYTKFVCEYWKQFKNQKLYTNLLKCLTQNLIYTFLSSKI
ncbi:unnamed protein product [Spodoptera littoralis]|uniref:Uncharacterized protein n=1 Tax=Spodoptera littoralis TaxID=7109 RepID=A0A9P0ICM6_SPOLI|nr:unnamed protein product [Spodoptera littoralis]